MFPVTAERVVDFCIKLIDLVIDTLGVERAKALMTLDNVKRANAVADAVEYVRFSIVK